jgi:SAM-dependent methyltransferase
MAVFDSLYAGQYDQLYVEKNYAQENAVILEAVKRYGKIQPQSVIDLGCGTGSHSLLLAKDGYAVTGVDMAPAMIKIAQHKADKLLSTQRPHFMVGDLRNFEGGGPFDLAIMMFAVISYLNSNEDLLAGLKNIRRHLKAGALLVCDFWYGPAVLAVRPTERIREIRLDDDSTVIRHAKTSLNSFNHTGDVSFKLWTLKGKQLESVTEETHTMRYLFPQEFKLALQMTGFELDSLSAFPSLDAPLTDDTWNALAVARAI